MKFKLLNQKNPDYKGEQIKKLELLYKGGEDLLEQSHLFIPKEQLESDIAYHSRLKCSSYRNYFAQIVNDYSSNLFAKSMSIIPAADANDKNTNGEDLPKADPFYHDFATDADLCGKTLLEVLRDLLIEALSSGRAYLGVDFPKANELPDNLAQEEEMGIDRAYTFSIPTLSMIDWECDDEGKYIYVILRNDIIKRAKITDVRDKKTIQFKVWQKENEKIIYKIYQIEVKIGKEPKDDDECIEIESGEVSFKDIPILCLDMPCSLWIGGLIGNLIVDHFKRYSSLIFAQNRSLFALPVYKQGPELPANGDLNEKQANPNRGQQQMNEMKSKGFAVIGSDDEIEFKEPAGTSYELINEQLKDLVDTIYQVVNQISNTVNAGTKNQDRSGLSKVMDNHSKEIILEAYASLIKKFSVELYNLISEGRNENIIWQAMGMNDFHIIDRNALLVEATSLNLINIPSPTFKKIHLNKLALELSDDLTPETQLVIKKEIDEAVDKMGEDVLYNMAVHGKPTNPEEDAQNQIKIQKAKSGGMNGKLNKSG